MKVISIAMYKAGSEVPSVVDHFFSRLWVMTLDGVGRKVADCVLLFGLHKLDAFPVDTWMKKASGLWENGFPTQFFGETAGIAQQYIFYYVRSQKSVQATQK